MKSRLQTTLGPPRQGPTSLDPPALPRTAALRARAALAGVAEACQGLHVGGPPSLDPPVLPRTVALRARAALAGAVGAAAPGPSRAAEREGEGAGEARQGGGRRGGPQPRHARAGERRPGRTGRKTERERGGERRVEKEKGREGEAASACYIFGSPDSGRSRRSETEKR